MRIPILVCLALLAPGCASLTREQIAYESAYQTLHVIDTVQTLNIKKDDWRYEKNPILGRHPSDGEVIAYMASEAAAHFLITKALADRNAPKWLQRAWHYGSVGWNGRVVLLNYKTGL